ncbi:MAG: V-type ATPase subunit [Candidatus Thermoplasmatota archaeon]|jgi:V/A-type H+-transporting ATPase subunit C|nr:V-type ATPase subunit [Candidatus Thermoplasmatota archaeon]
MDSTYAGSAAKARILKGELLSDEDIERILDAKTPTDIIALMDGTPYQEHLKALSTFYSGYDLLELASTRRMITFVLKIVESPPAGGLEPIRSYISRWDIDSIKSIITSKFLGKKVEKEDLFIVDAGRFPIGMTSNLITKEDYSLMINENDVEGITKYLTKLGYGVYMLRFLDEYRKEKDISILLYALDIAYFSRLIDSIKFFRGDEEPLRHYFREQVDIKNITTAIKAKDLRLDFPAISSGIIEYGNITLNQIRDMYSSLDAMAMKESALKIFGVDESVDIKNIDLGDLEVIIRKYAFRKNIPNLASQSSSLGAIFNSIILAENERNNLRRIFASKAHGLEKDQIKKMLVL